MGALGEDIRYAVRRLVRTPAFTAGALAIMAIAIAVNTTAFALVNEMLLRPAPFERPEEVVRIYQDSDDGAPGSTSFPAYREMAAMDEVFAAVAATSPDGATLELAAGPQPVTIEYTTASYLSLIGPQMSRGRWFDASMDEVGSGNFAVVSHHAWLNRFGADPSVVGRTVRLNGQPVTVIGVGPEGFNGMGGFQVTDLWLSISSVGIGGAYRVENLERRQDHWYDVSARLATGVTTAQAQEVMRALAERLAEAYPDLNQGRDITVFAASDVRVHPSSDGQLYSTAGLLMTIVLLVLVLACSNLGGLLLVRGVARRGEVAVRRALGAASQRISRLFFSEAMILSVAGGALGILVARGLLDLLTAVSLPFVGPLNLPLSGPVVLFSLGLMLGTGLFFGWAPALQSLRGGLSDALREDARPGGGGRGRSAFRNLMVCVQVAVSLILVAGATVLVRTLASYQQIDVGVDTERIAFVGTDFSQAGIGSDARAAAADDLLRRVRALPGVRSAALTTRLPLQGGGSTTTVVEGYTPASGTGAVELDFTYVTPAYFSTMGVSISDGRGFTEDDRLGEAMVIVNEAAAARFWGGQSPIGRRMRPQSAPDGWYPVIGVASDVKVASFSEPPTPLLYFVIGATPPSAFNLVVRTDGDPAALTGGLREAVRSVNPALPIHRLNTLEGHLGNAMVAPRAAAAALGSFSVLALLLASVGIYTIVSFTVAGRIGEIGIRLALGAASGRVVRMVVAEVALVVGVGLALGCAGFLFLAPRAGSLLGSASVNDPLTLGTALLVLGTAVAIASYLPARRAARVDPVEALRTS
jgi:predicted permease